MAEDCIIVLDDFEGVEKGVVNAMMLRGVLKNYILLEPMVDRNGVVLNLAIMVLALYYPYLGNNHYR